MTYVIGEACIGTMDRSCLDVCPIDCIHEVEERLVIDPGECIDCALCEPACPVSAVSPAEGVPVQERAVIAINAAWTDGPDEVNGCWPSIAPQRTKAHGHLLSGVCTSRRPSIARGEERGGHRSVVTGRGSPPGEHGSGPLQPRSEAHG
jgi:ferredoxin